MTLNFKNSANDASLDHTNEEASTKGNSTGQTLSIPSKLDSGNAFGAATPGVSLKSNIESDETSQVCLHFSDEKEKLVIEEATPKDTTTKPAII